MAIIQAEGGADICLQPLKHSRGKFYVALRYRRDAIAARFTRQQLESLVTEAEALLAADSVATDKEGDTIA